MTRRAARQRPDVVFFNEFSTESELVRGRLIFHVEDLLARAHELFGRAVTLETPVHIQRVDAPRERHLIDAPMAGGAADSLVHVNAVIEIDKLRQIVDARPLDRFAGPKALAHRRESRAIRPNLRVAIHADFCRRNAGKRARLDRCVAVPAIDAIIANVMLVTKRDRLRARDSYF